MRWVVGVEDDVAVAVVAAMGKGQVVWAAPQQLDRGDIVSARVVGIENRMWLACRAIGKSVPSVARRWHVNDSPGPELPETSSGDQGQPAFC
jgi:hypothetical protein